MSSVCYFIAGTWLSSDFWHPRVVLGPIPLHSKKTLFPTLPPPPSKTRWSSSIQKYEDIKVRERFIWKKWSRREPIQTFLFISMLLYWFFFLMLFHSFLFWDLCCYCLGWLAAPSDVLWSPCLCLPRSWVVDTCLVPVNFWGYYRLSWICEK